MTIEEQQDLINLLENQRSELLEKVKSVSDTIELIKQSIPKKLGYNNEIPILKNNYDPSLSIKAKVQFFFKQEQRFLHNRELAELANSNEPKISVKEFIKKFSSHLSSLKREGKLTKYVINKQNNNTFWGSPKWVDEKGEILEQYMYNEKYIKKTGNDNQFEL